MKKRKLVLNRETLRSLELGRAAGGATIAGTCLSVNHACSYACDNTKLTGDFTHCATCFECSDACTTGGACTL